MKAGFDFRRQEQFQFFLPQTRGRLQYANLQRLIDDQATVAQINAALPGGELITYFRYYDYFFFFCGGRSVQTPSNASADMPIDSESVGCG